MSGPKRNPLCGVRLPQENDAGLQVECPLLKTKSQKMRRGGQKTFWFWSEARGSNFSFRLVARRKEKVFVERFSLIGLCSVRVLC
jgi:hypothetical protein